MISIPRPLQVLGDHDQLQPGSFPVFHLRLSSRRDLRPLGYFHFQTAESRWGPQWPKSDTCWPAWEPAFTNRCPKKPHSSLGCFFRNHAVENNKYFLRNRTKQDSEEAFYPSQRKEMFNKSPFLQMKRWGEVGGFGLWHLWPFKEEGRTQDSAPLRVSLSGILIYPSCVSTKLGPAVHSVRPHRRPSRQARVGRAFEADPSLGPRRANPPGHGRGPARRRWRNAGPEGRGRGGRANGRARGGAGAGGLALR